MQEYNAKVNQMEGQARAVEKKEEIAEKQKAGGAKPMPSVMQVPADMKQSPEPQEEIKGKIVERHEKFDVVEEGPNSFRYVPKQKPPPGEEIQEEKKDAEEKPKEDTEAEPKKSLEDVKFDAIEEFKNSDFAKEILAAVEQDLTF